MKSNEIIEAADKEKIPEVRIQVDYRPGRWGKVFHIFDLDNREIVLHQKEATAMARKILSISQQADK